MRVEQAARLIDAGVEPRLVIDDIGKAAASDIDPVGNPADGDIDRAQQYIAPDFRQRALDLRSPLPLPDEKGRGDAIEALPPDDVDVERQSPP